MTNRYNHWFWNSKLVAWIHRHIIKLDGWLWACRFSKFR